MTRDTQEQVIIFPAGTAANGSSVAKEMQSYWHVYIEVVTTGFSGTIKFQCSDQEAGAPDLSGVQGATGAANAWDYVQVKKLTNNTSIDGATGVPYVTATGIERYEFNQNGGRWYGATISGYAAGSIQVKFKGYGT